MKILIDIPSEMLEDAKADMLLDIELPHITNAIANGIPLEQEPSGETKNRHKCNQCKYLSDEKCTIGRKCIHPTKLFHTSTACWKYPSCKACKLFEEKDGRMTTDYKAFAEWVAEEIFDENWEYNKDAFAELACRKLAKLGIVIAKGDEWVLVEPQESEGSDANKPK